MTSTPIPQALSGGDTSELRNHVLGFDRLQYILFVLVGYASSQAHELAHWATAMAMGASRLVMGFDRWYLSSLKGPLWPVLAAGPITTLSLALLGLVLLRQGDTQPVKRLGAFLAFYNSVFDLGSVTAGIVRTSLGMAGEAPLYDLSCSELAWKILLAPISASILVLCIAYGARILQVRVLRLTSGLFLPTIIVSLIIKSLDTIAWLGYNRGYPLFTVVHGFIAMVILLNAVVLALLVVVKLLEG